MLGRDLMKNSKLSYNSITPKSLVELNLKKLSLTIKGKFTKLGHCQSVNKGESALRELKSGLIWETEFFIGG